MKAQTTNFEFHPENRPHEESDSGSKAEGEVAGSINPYNAVAWLRRNQD